MAKPQAPGLTWNRHGNPVWRASRAAIKAGYPLKSANLASLANDPANLVSRCERLQAEMRAWLAGYHDQAPSFDGTIASLIRFYQTDPESGYHTLKPSGGDRDQASSARHRAYDGPPCRARRTAGYGGGEMSKTDDIAISWQRLQDRLRDRRHCNDWYMRQEAAEEIDKLMVFIGWLEQRVNRPMSGYSLVELDALFENARNRIAEIRRRQSSL